MGKKSAILILLIITWIVGVQPVSGESSPRNFILLFELLDYSNQLSETLDYFLRNVYKMGDRLMIFSPGKGYDYFQKRFDSSDPEEIKIIKSLLKKDIEMASVRHKILLQNMSKTLNSPHLYSQYRKDLTAAKNLLEDKILACTNILRHSPGDNHILLFYQIRYRPVPRSIDRNRSVRRTDDTVNFVDSSPRNPMNYNEAYIWEDMNLSFNVSKVKTALKYAKTKFHFLYLKKKKSGGFTEDSGDLYSIFSKLAKKSHGKKITSGKPMALIKDFELLVKGKVKVEVVEENTD